MDAIEMKDFSNSGSDGDENKKRGNWGNKADFVLSCIGFAVGLGNVWRFPYLCFSNGGGAFLIPYAVCLALAGLPLFYFELALGQFASLGCVGIWKCSPIFSGLGYGMVIVTGLVCVYYNVIIAWTILYLIASFTKIPGVPWDGCGNWWNTELCFAGKNASNLTAVVNGTNVTYVRSTQEYWDWFVLRRSESINESGELVWQLALCLLLAWTIVYLCIIKGVKTSGKVVYVTATFPYIILIVLFIRGITLPGSKDGVLFFIRPTWSTLTKPKVWKDAATQIFYSLGVAFGSLQTLGSYNKFHNNCYADALIVALTNCGTSVFAGFVIFSIIGFMAHDMGVEVADVADSGQGLAFVAYPEAISRLPISPLWAILFFLMLFTLGLDSQFVMMETVITAVLDSLSDAFRKRKALITGIMCAIWFLLGLPCVLNSGVYWTTLLDWYSASFALIIISILECLVVSLVYGIRRFCDDIKAMIGFRPNIYWQACWVVITPLILSAILIYSFVEYSPASYASEQFPVWADALGWMMVLFELTPLCVYAVYITLKQEGDLFQKIKKALRPAPDWGPALNKHRIEAGYTPLEEDASGDGKGPDYWKGVSSAYVNGGYDRQLGEPYVYPDTNTVGSQCDIEKD
ncbi:sodium-dependent proline transporter-like [Ptychodera flava]|uniref:sodium-dependent proline transporter-like n=1 Tax=Ptychodera flava TaxID=63121 RepID=UPI00396A2FA5